MHGLYKVENKPTGRNSIKSEVADIWFNPVDDEPVFTQAMADNGDLPPINSVVELGDFDNYDTKFDMKSIEGASEM